MEKPGNLGRGQNKAKANILARLQSGDRDCLIVASNLFKSLLILSFSFMVNIISLNSVLGLKANTPQSKVALQVVVLNCKVTKEQIPLTTKPGPPGH